ncbi:MAG: fluoride efflux transporter CrcB [Thermodesulfovibrionia bacterium]|nr:fluoride efflux transporter CrcB [Thermodesulfovibrionia bacterium]
MTKIIIVGSGGFLGSVARYLLSGWVYDAMPFAGFPLGTLVVNVLGCLVIGFLGGLAEARNVLGPDVRLFLFIGFLGGFTTFSSFGHETMALFRDAENVKAFANIIFHITICLSAVWIGNAISRAI